MGWRPEHRRVLGKDSGIAVIVEQARGEAYGAWAVAPTGAELTGLAWAAARLELAGDIQPSCITHGCMEPIGHSGRRWSSQ